MKKVRIPVHEIIGFLGSDILTVLGSVGDAFIDNVADAAHTTETTLDWINPAKANKQEIAEKNRAKVMLVDPTIEYSSKLQNTDKVLIVVERPKITLSKIITEFFLEKKISFIHPTVVIDNKAMIDATAFIDAGCVIGKATIGRN